MPDFDAALAEIAGPSARRLVPILVIVLFACVALRLARLFVHGIVQALLDREATEGTAQELSAVEVKKRMDTLDGLGATSSGSSSWRSPG